MLLWLNTKLIWPRGKLANKRQQHIVASFWLPRVLLQSFETLCDESLFVAVCPVCVFTF